MFRRLRDIIFTRSCIICGHRLKAEEGTLCEECHSHLPFTNYHLDGYENELARLFWGLIPIEQATSYFFYTPSTELTELITLLKYKGQTQIGYDLASMAAKEIKDSGFFDGIDIIVPVPITRLRKWQRGYNQSDYIARGISKVTGIPVNTHCIKRTKFTHSQTRMSRIERLHNTDNAFAVTDAQALTGKHILLVDDIITTGTTMRSLAKTISTIPGIRVSIFSLGRTV